MTMEQVIINTLDLEALNNKILNLRSELEYYEKQDLELSLLCAKEIDAIIKKLIKQAIKEIRLLDKQTKDVRFLGEDYNLNFLEQLCVVSERGDTGIYPGIEMYMNTLAEELYNNLTPLERYILDKHYEDDDVYYNIKIAIIGYLANYSNKNIRAALEIY